MRTLLVMMGFFLIQTSGSLVWGMGRGRVEDSVPEISSQEVPAHPLLWNALPGGAPLSDTELQWELSDRTLPAYVLVFEKRLWQTTSDRRRFESQWIEFSPDPRVRPGTMTLMPDRFRVRLRPDGRPDVVVTHSRDSDQPWAVDITFSPGFFGKDRAEIERLEVLKGIKTEVARFYPRLSAGKLAFSAPPSDPIHQLKGAGSLNGYTENDESRRTPWVAPFSIVLRLQLTHAQWKSLRKRIQDDRAPVFLELAYDLALTKPAQPGQAPRGTERRVDTLTEWVRHSASGALACVDLRRNGEARAERQGDCADYWD